MERADFVVSNPDLFQRLASALSDRYGLEGEIGSGGMATVYLAEDRKHHRKVAIKVLHPDLTKSLGAERFVREIRTTANFHHPHILPLFDSGEADGLLYYVMPFVRGESLRSRLEREGQLPIHDAVRIAREIADALNFAHEQGVIHRDVKPANILLDAGHAMLADFGVAQALAFAEDTTLTGSGTFLGTPTYMSPEQAAGGEVIDGRSDQYALGCVLYEMLSGHPPFGGPRAEVILRQQWAADPPALGKVRGSIPPPVSAVVARALKKRPEERYATALDMAVALEAALPNRAPVLGSLLRRPVALGLSAGLIATAAIAVTLAIKGASLPPRETVPGTPRVVAQRQVSFSGTVDRFAISHDGRLVAYTERSGEGSRILVQRIDGGDHRVIHESADATVQSLWWMPGGQSLGFRTRVRISRPLPSDGSPLPWSTMVSAASSSIRDYEVPVIGGRVEDLEKSIDPQGPNLRWSPDGQRAAWGWDGSFPNAAWISQASPPLVQVNPPRANSSVLLSYSGLSSAFSTAPTESTHFRELDLQPTAWSPDGRWLAHVGDTPQGDSISILLFSIDSGESFPIWGGWGLHPQLETSKAGVLLLRGPPESRELLIVPLDWKTGYLRGEATTIGFFEGALGFSASESGRLILRRGRWSDRGRHTIARISVNPDQFGSAHLESLPWSREVFSTPVVSPDGTKVAAIRGLMPNQQLVVFDLSDGSTRAISKPMTWMGRVTWSTTGRFIGCLALEGGMILAHAFDVATGRPLGKGKLPLDRRSLLAWRTDEALYYGQLGTAGFHYLQLPLGQETRAPPELSNLGDLWFDARWTTSVAVSPSGDSLAYPRSSPMGLESPAWIGFLHHELGAMEFNAAPLAWSSEGLYLAVVVGDSTDVPRLVEPWDRGRKRPKSLWIVRSESGIPEKLVEFGDLGVPPCLPSSMSLDGKVLVCRPNEGRSLQGADLWVVDLDSDGPGDPGS